MSFFIVLACLLSIEGLLFGLLFYTGINPLFVLDHLLGLQAPMNVLVVVPLAVTLAAMLMVFSIWVAFRFSQPPLKKLPGRKS